MEQKNRCLICDDSKMGIMPKMTPAEKKKWEKDCLSEASALKTCLIYCEKRASGSEEL